MKNVCSIGRFSIYILLAVISTTVKSANILVFAPLPFKSHFTGFLPMFKELANRGHNVTVLSAFPLKKPIANYTDIPIIVEESILKGIDPMHLASYNFWTVVPSLWKLTAFLSPKMLSKPNVQNFILSEDYEFDLVIVFAFGQDYSIALGHKYKAPVINLSVTMLWPSNSKWIGEPSTFSYILDHRTAATDRMSFTDRFKNTVIGMFQLFLEDYYYMPTQIDIMNKYFRYKEHEFRPPIEDMLRNVSLMLVNAHHSVGVTRPYSAGTIEVAGLHVNQPKPLTGKFLEFVESAKDGVIYFSFGTIIEPSNLPDSFIRIFIEVLKKVKQKVMWKWNSKNLPQLPDHVMVSDWFPQSDILGHSNVRLFITHGGLHSLEEATYNAIPVVGIPFFADQYMNMRLVEQNGIGKMVDHIGLSEDAMLSAINEVMAGPKYTDNLKFKREVFNDRQMKPIDLAVYWVEYVLRHNGARHLKNNASALNYIHFFSMDICFLIVSAVILNAFAITKIIKCIVKNKNRHSIKKNK